MPHRMLVACHHARRIRDTRSLSLTHKRTNVQMLGLIFLFKFVVNVIKRAISSCFFLRKMIFLKYSSTVEQNVQKKARDNIRSAPKFFFHDDVHALLKVKLLQGLFAFKINDNSLFALFFLLPKLNKFSLLCLSILAKVRVFFSLF